MFSDLPNVTELVCGRSRTSPWNGPLSRIEKPSAHWDAATVQLCILQLCAHSCPAAREADTRKSTQSKRERREEDEEQGDCCLPSSNKGYLFLSALKKEQRFLSVEVIYGTRKALPVRRGFQNWVSFPLLPLPWILKLGSMCMIC